MKYLFIIILIVTAPAINSDLKTKAELIQKVETIRQSAEKLLDNGPILSPAGPPGVDHGLPVEK